MAPKKPNPFAGGGDKPCKKCKKMGSACKC